VRPNDAKACSDRDWPEEGIHMRPVESEKEYVLSAIARVIAKRDAQTDELSRFYYSACLVGWEAHLKRLG
jgi:hypothetical protein